MAGTDGEFNLNIRFNMTSENMASVTTLHACSPPFSRNDKIDCLTMLCCQMELNYQRNKINCTTNTIFHLSNRNTLVEVSESLWFELILLM